MITRLQNMWFGRLPLSHKILDEINELFALLRIGGCWKRVAVICHALLASVMVWQYRLFLRMGLSEIYRKTTRDLGIWVLMVNRQWVRKINLKERSNSPSREEADPLLRERVPVHMNCRHWLWWMATTTCMSWWSYIWMRSYPQKRSHAWKRIQSSAGQSIPA